jgi:hypothetical protein
MNRKPIQIAVTHIPEHLGFDPKTIYTVVCNDGTIWEGDGNHCNPWYQLLDIPQPNEEAQESSAELTLKLLGYTDNKGVHWNLPLGTLKEN